MQFDTATCFKMIIISIMEEIGLKVRQSNFELLRILSMFLILSLHANYTTFGTPNTDSSNISICFRTICETMCIVGVNVFILISGWFGIKPKFKVFLSLLYQVLFFSVIAVIISFYNGGLNSSIIVNNFYIGAPYWFVVSYIGLYILSPLLNSFVEQTNSKTILVVIISFFIYQFLYGWIFELAGFRSGYSLMSFCELYLIARYLKIFRSKITRISCTIDVFIYFLFAFFSAFILCFLTLMESPFLLSVQSKVLSYNSPLVIVSSVFLFMAFAKINFSSRLINYIAGSCFAVYLLHANNYTLPIYSKYAMKLVYDRGGIPSIVLILSYIVFVFILGILIDFVRRNSWELVVKLFTNLK